MTTGARHWGQETGSGLASPRRGGGSCSRDRSSSDAVPGGFPRLSVTGSCPRPMAVIRQPRRTRPQHPGAAAFPIIPDHDAGCSGQRRVLRGRANGLRGGGRPMRLPRGADRQSLHDARDFVAETDPGFAHCAVSMFVMPAVSLPRVRPGIARVPSKAPAVFVLNTNMAKGNFGCLKKKGSRVVTSAALEMGRLVRLAASPVVPGEHVDYAIGRAARRLGFTRGRVKSFWYGKARGPSPEELETARKVAVKHAQDLELLRNEHRRAVEILARLETRLAVIDEDFHQPDTSALRDMARAASRPGDAGRLTDASPEKGGA